MKRDEQDALRRREVQALERIDRALAELKPHVAYEPRPGSHELGRFPALRTALRLCRDVTAGEGLVQRFRRLPPEYVNAAERTIRCVCGASMPWGDLRPCPGLCGRWFAADASGAWAARFEDAA